MKSKNQNPLIELRDKVIGMIEITKKESNKLNQKVKVNQHIKIEGNGNVARQGDIHIYLIQQQVLIALYELKDSLDAIINDGFCVSESLDFKEIQKLVYKKALNLTNGNKIKAAKLLGIKYRTFREHMRLFERKENER